MKRDATPELSIVVPVFCESVHLAHAIAEIHRHAESVCACFEIILVDDGSTDDTWSVLAAAAARHPWLRAVRLSRNFGKEHALAAGLDAAAGRSVLVMDGDLQHPPALIPEMVRRWRKGDVDIVEGVKASRGDETLMSRLFAAAFYRALRLLSGLDLRGASDFKLIDRKVLLAWQRLRERNLFFRGMVAWVGFRRATVNFDVQRRLAGQSRWSPMALIRLAGTAMTGFSSGLLQVVTAFGVAFLVGAILLGAYALVVWYTGRAVTGFTTVILLQLIEGSLIMVSLGVIGLYLARIYDELKRRPRYIIAETAGVPEGRGAEGIPGAATDPDALPPERNEA